MKPMTDSGRFQPITGQLSFRLEAHERAPGAELARAAWKKSGGKGGFKRGRRPPPRRGRR